MEVSTTNFQPLTLTGTQQQKLFGEGQDPLLISDIHFSQWLLHPNSFLRLDHGRLYTAAFKCGVVHLIANIMNLIC